MLHQLTYFSELVLITTTFSCSDAHVKLLELLLQIETSLLEIANKNMPMEELSKSMRNKIKKRLGTLKEICFGTRRLFQGVLAVKRLF